MSPPRCKSKLSEQNPGDHKIAKCYHKVNGQYIHYKPNKASEGKEIVTTYDGNGRRDLIVPNRKFIELPGIFPKSEYERLKVQSRVLTQKDRLAMKEEADKKKLQLEDECEKRKEALRKSQLEQKAATGSKMQTVETDAAAKRSYVLQRAFELRQEQEDEVKKASGLILATKCLAIREAQLMERKLMTKELQEEDHRLDMMMEQLRQRGLKEEAEKHHNREISNQRYVAEVSQQIRENEIQRLVEAEQKEEEARNMNRAMIRMQQDDAEKIRQKHLKQAKQSEELNQANQEIEHYKIVQKEEQRIADMRVQIFMKNKAEREAAFEAEQAAIKIAKDLEVARLIATQEKAQDSQAAADELNALRIQEEVEQKWREKERQAAIRKKTEAEAMRQGREKQLEDIRKAQALEIERDKREFFQVAKVQNESYEKDQKKKQEKRAGAVRHRQELLKQVNEREKERIIGRRETFEEGTALKMEQDVRSLQINQTLRKKVQRLRDNKVPENLVRDIERQLNIA